MLRIKNTVFSNWRYSWIASQMSYERQQLLTLSERLGSSAVFSEVRVAHHFSFLCCVCPRPVFCVSNIASVSWLRLLFFSQKNLKIPKAKRKRANNVLQNITEKTKDRATRTDINRKFKIGKLKPSLLS